ncbi:MAG: AAA family ATPase [Pseudomonadota bacterium]|nr:AAA family ATPase [Pseudomonadota bacterium]
MPDLVDLEIIMLSRVPIIVIETFEEPRALDLIKRAGMKLQKPVFSWSVTEGVQRIDLAHGVPEHLTTEPGAALAHIKQTGRAGVYILCDFHPFLCEAPKNVRLLKEIAMGHDEHHHTLILLSHALDIPPEIQRYCARMDLSLPNDEQLMHLVKEEASVWSSQNRGAKVKTDNQTLSKLVSNLRGLTYSDARRLARGAIFDDGAITASDLPELNRAKFELLGMEGVLSFEYDTSSFADVGGLNGLKEWLSKRRDYFLNPRAGVDSPKGVLLLGVQGGGKSLAAKAVAGMWGVPLLRLDFSALYNKYIGETEKNLRESLAMADTLAPCVLWLDEIEKALSVDASDNGTSKRLLGALLTWMAERRQPVFLVATSNDISRMPPELVRKGRLDEIFFVDLPSEVVRRDIFSIHLRKRFQNPEGLDLDSLARASDGFSGAEIEQAVVSGLYRCQAEAVELDTQHLLQEIASTQPLSIVMAERLAELRTWAAGRTVAAD